MLHGPSLHRHAIALLGAPWQDRGRGPALDCLGLVLAAARAAGHELPDPAVHGPLCWRDLWTEVEIPEPGDLVIWDRGDRVHLALVASDRRSVVHATREAGVARTPLTAVAGELRGYRRLACR